MINAVSSYLQNQPLTNKEAHDAQDVKDVDNKVAKEAKANPEEAVSGYVPSYRAVAVSALANEFNVHDLDNKELAKLEQKIQYYGLLQGRAMDALGLLRSTANEGEQKKSGLDAVEVLDKISHKYDDYQIGYQQRQAIGQIHSLFMNLSSARPAEKAP